LIEVATGEPPLFIPHMFDVTTPLPLGVVAKAIGTIVAVALAWGSLQGEMKVLKTEVNHLNQRMERIEQKLDRLPLYRAVPEK
jgi:hypothetical protein